MSADQHQQTAAVVGLGRFGRFWAEKLTSEYTVVGTSRREVPDLPTGVRQVPLEDALQADIVFLTVAISAMPEVLDQIRGRLRSDATVVDTCSVKVFPVREMEARLPAAVDIIATHPMFGPDSARERTDPLPVITWPVRDNHRRYRELLSTFSRLNMRVEEMRPDDHDREAAFSQGVTHLVGRILREMDLQPSEIATLGYTRLLQVMEQTCNDPVSLFQDLQRYNPYTREMRQRFADALMRTEGLLAQGERRES
ncbi:MAG: prephenate dehydrogenase/arogenate dehydrogenase family protein [Alkalispirochaeta sp.]